MIKPGFVNFQFTDFKREEYDKENEKILESKLEIDYLFYGDSITEWWNLEKFFPTERILVNRAIAGDRTRYMLYRFDGDCTQLKPKKIIFMGGINDLRGWDLGHDYTEGMTEESIKKEIFENIYLMYTKAKANNIEFIVGSILPINEDSEINNDRVNKKVEEINKELEEFCKKENLIFIDYYQKVLEQGTNKIRKELTAEGLHPNDEGYALMAEILKEKIKF